MASAPKVPVRFRFEGAPGRPVALTGDFPDWKYPVAMTEGPSGSYSVELRLEPGLYRYKFLVDRRRYVDPPDAPIVDRAEGPLNGLVVVGGTLPPLYFAPDRRHVVVFEDGRLVLLGEVDAGADVPEEVWIQSSSAADVDPSDRDAADADRGQPQLLRVAVRRGVERGGKQQFRAEHRFAAHAHFDDDSSDPSVWFGFIGHPSYCFTLAPPRPAIGQPPAWLDGAVFYGIFIDRWRRASSSPPHPQAHPRSARSIRDRFYGGDLVGIAEDLPKVAQLGVTAIVLTPVHPSPTPHRYDGLDLLSVDPLIGGEVAFRELIKTAHSLGLKVVADLSTTHVAEQHPAFRDVLERQEASAFLPWFRIRSFPVVPFKTFGNYDYYYDRPDLPLLNLEPGSPARAHALEAALRLVEMGIDGLRLDALNDAPVSFWQELRVRARSIRPDLLLLGEIVTDRPVRFAEELGIDTGTDFQHREAMLQFFAEDHIEASEFWNKVCFAEHRLGPFDPSFRLLFLDNHDTERFLSTTKDRTRLAVALAYLMFRPEPVWLTYGTEYELHAGLGRVDRLDDAWPERLPMPDGREAGPPPLGDLIRALTTLRRGVFSRAGGIRCTHAESSALVLERDLDDGWLRLAIDTKGQADPSTFHHSLHFESDSDSDSDSDRAVDVEILLRIPMPRPIPEVGGSLGDPGAPSQVLPHQGTCARAELVRFKRRAARPLAPAT